MTHYLLAFVIAAIVFGVLDAIWLSNSVDKLYRPIIGELMADKVDWAAGLTFYTLYILGMIWFAIRPGLAAEDWTVALLNGALLGGLCYATYDLTSQAVLKVWSWKLSLIDIAWGTFATGTTSAVTALLLLRVLKV